MYRHICVPVDNSEWSNRAIELAVELGRAFNAKLTGCHVYPARLHGYRFKQMEFTLPEAYRVEATLERQREIHDSLIAMGLRLISDSYLDVMAHKVASAGLVFARKLMDGRHYKVLVEDARASDYDLVVMGGLGMGAVKDSLLGSVTERFIRHVTTDTLVVRSRDPLPEGGGRIVACLDGSPRSFDGLGRALALSRALGRPVQAIAVYDSYLRFATFDGLSEVPSDRAFMIRRHRSHLEAGGALAAREGIDLPTRLLEGKCFQAILAFAREEKPWLLIMGRTGTDADDEEAGLGSTTGALVRLAPCNVLVTGGKPSPDEASPVPGGAPGNRGV